MGNTSVFNYKEIDHEGLETLDVISVAHKFNRWIYETIKPYSKGRILEVGSGIGNISQFYFDDGFEITLSDIRENYCSIIREKFKSQKTLKEVIHLDLIANDFESRYGKHLNS